MKIVRVTCRGFKTYRDTMTVGPLDPQLNCIVGMNGSGKSSLFGAILFVLSPFSGGLSSSASFLHEGPTGKALSGFAELELDNSDQSFPLDSVRVILRRTLAGINKNDEFMINGKHVSRAEYTTLLQAAGLVGRKNSKLPFFVVEQGRIAATAVVSDSERFQMLKEAAGVDVFDEKRAESLATLEETETKRTRVQELLAEIDAKCKELQLETVAMQEFSNLKREKEWTEYQAAALEKEQLVKIRSELGREIEAKKQDLERLQFELSEIHAGSVSEAETEVPDIPLASGKLARITLEISKKRAEKSELDQALSWAKMQLDQAASWLAEMEAKRDQMTAELESRFNTANEQRLERSRLVQTQQELETQIEQTESESVSEESLLALKNSTQRRLGMLENDLNKKEEEMHNLVEKVIPVKQQELADIESELRAIDAMVQEKEEARKLKSQQVKEKHAVLFQTKQKGFETDRQIQKLESEFNDASGSVLRSSNWNTRDLVSRSDLPGVKGLFGEFVKIPSAYRVAVESLFRAVLFNVVVESDEVADVIAKKLTGGKGRVTLTPINRVSNGERQPTVDLAGFNAQLLSSVIQPRDQSEQWTQAMIDKFFSKTAVVDTIDTGVEVAKRFRIDAVTLDGDVVSKDLVVKGGDLGGARRMKKIELVRNWQHSLELKSKITELRRDQVSVTGEIKQLEEELKQLEIELSLGSATEANGVSVAELRTKHGMLKRELHSIVERKTELEKFEIANLGDVEIPSLKEDLARIERDLKNRPAEDERVRERPMSLPSLHNRLAQVKDRLMSSEKELSLLNKQTMAVRSELEHFIPSRIEHLSELVGERKREFAHISSKSEQLGADLTRMEAVDLKQAQLAAETQKTMEEETRSLKSQERNEKMNFEEKRAKIEQEIESIIAFLKTKEMKLTNVDADIVAAGASMRNLSSVPSHSTITACASDRECLNRLRKLRARMVEITTELSAPKFSYLNKKALEQFERVSAEQQELHRRHSELEDSYKSIRQLLDDMAEKEYGMVRDAFGRIQSHFRALFRNVIGEGATVDLTLTIGDDSKMGLTGSVSISGVSFPDGSEKPRTKHLRELSGGQRTMIAICFLISLQKAAMQPKSSFFLLDEVDAALDANYRLSLADALANETIGSRSQIIATSFRPEISSVANKHWFVSMMNGSTRVESTDMPHVMNFVRGNDANLNVLNDNPISVRE